MDVLDAPARWLLGMAYNGRNRMDARRCRPVDHCGILRGIRFVPSRQPHMIGRFAIFAAIFVTGIAVGIGLYQSVLHAPFVSDLAAKFAVKFDAANARGGPGGVLCLGASDVNGPVRMPRDCPPGTWAWIRTGTDT